MTDKNPDPTHIRLAKRVAEQLNCSRSTAEQFIEGGFVSVEGAVVEAPGARVALQHNLGLGGACVVTMYRAA